MTNTPEFLNIRISQSVLLKYNISLHKYILLDYASKHKKFTAPQIIDEMPSLYKSDTSVRRQLDSLIADGFLEQSAGFVDKIKPFNITEEGKKVMFQSRYKPNYSSEDFLVTCDFLSAWNSLEECQSHIAKPYGEKQTKTIEEAIAFIVGLRHNKIDLDKVRLYRKPLTIEQKKQLDRKITLPEILFTINQYPEKFKKDNLPEDKKGLVLTFNQFFRHWKGYHSEFYDILLNGIQSMDRTIDGVTATGISIAMLKKTYSTLSETGNATASEKLQIQQSIIRMHRKYSEHLNDVLTPLYWWKKAYKERVLDFNMFLYEYLSFIDREMGRGKSGYISFREGNKVMEGFSKYFIDKYNLFLWPTRLKTEELKKIALQKSKGVVQ